jgi:hypothetical protein
MDSLFQNREHDDRHKSIAIRMLRPYGMAADDDDGILLETREEFECSTELASILCKIDRNPMSDHYWWEPARNLIGKWDGKLADLMWPLGYFWVLEIDAGELPGGPFPDPADIGPPKQFSGARFVYDGLRALGLRFSDAEFFDQFLIMKADLGRHLARDPEDYGCSDMP